MFINLNKKTTQKRVFIHVYYIISTFLNILCYFCFKHFFLYVIYSLQFLVKNKICNQKKLNPNKIIQQIFIFQSRGPE